MATDVAEAATTKTAPSLSPPPRPFWARAVNAVGRGLDRLGARPLRIEPEALMDLARRRTRLDDFGEGLDDFDFRVPLDVLCRSLEEECHLHLLGRIMTREQLTRLLVNRLTFQDIWKKHPESLDVPVPAPLIVAGTPRSGTTMLHRLLALEATGRALLFWESMC